MLKADAVGNVLIHGPTLQPVQVLVEPLVPLWQEPEIAVLATVAGGGAADHLPADAPGGKLQVVGQLGMQLVGEPDDPPSLAARAGAAPDHDLPVHRQFRPLPRLAVMETGRPDRLAGSEVDLLPLVVEPGAAIDVVEVLHRELDAAPIAPTRRGRDLVRPGYQGGGLAAVRTFAPAPCSLADGLDELGHLLQGCTILRVVSQELVLPDGLPGLLPLGPPDQALEPGGVLLRPSAAQVSPDILEPIRVSGE